MKSTHLRDTFSKPAYAVDPVVAAERGVAVMNDTVDTVMRRYHTSLSECGKIVSTYPIFDFRFIEKKAKRARAKRKLIATVKRVMKLCAREDVKPYLTYSFFTVKKDGVTVERESSFNKKGKVIFTK